eukprot:346712-Karenia_brevis.AAC.1
MPWREESSMDSSRDIREVTRRRHESVSWGIPFTALPWPTYCRRGLCSQGILWISRSCQSSGRKL